MYSPSVDSKLPKETQDRLGEEPRITGEHMASLSIAGQQGQTAKKLDSDEKHLASRGLFMRS